MSSKDQFSIGYRYKNFVVSQNRSIPELQCSLIELIHEPSQARVIHIQNDDPENLFCLSFQTIPSSSNGAAHVLEHMVLCGSKKYPVRDPFFSMAKRSLHTFMNALTGSDFTCYPAATQIEKDFYNLLHVYLDAAFHPLLNDLNFLQEAHRFELKTDQNQPLTINGVVYNEMRGAMANPLRRLMRELYQHLFPNSPYGFDSGGDPNEIPTLTNNDLKQFHSLYYHPSRCLYFFYGNFPLSKHLDTLEESLLTISPPLISTHFPLQPRFTSAQFVTSFYPINPSDACQNKAYIAYAWLTTHIKNQLEVLALLILELVLLDTDASLLKYRLLQSGLCTQVLSSCDTEIAEIPFIIVTTGCDEENVDMLTTTIFSTLDEIVKTGLPKEQIEHALHQLEFSKSEINGDGSPFGLSLYSRTALLAHHGVDPILGLEIHGLFTELRQTIEDDPYFFQKLIQKYFTDNHHFVRLILSPSKELSEQEKDQHEKTLFNIYSQLSHQAKKQLTEETKQLTAFYNEPQDLNLLPSIHLCDVPRNCKHFPLNHETFDKIELFTHETFTNDIVYLDIATPLPKIESEDIWMVRLFAWLLPQLGCGNRSYQQNLEYMQAYTGGVGASLNLNRQATNPAIISPTFHLKGKALGRNKAYLAELIMDFLLTSRFDNSRRIHELLEKHLTDLENTITHHALDYAISASSASLSPPLALTELWYGMSYLQNLRNLVRNYAEKEDLFLEKLHSFQNMILLNNDIHLIAGADAKNLIHLKENQFWGLTETTSKASHPWENPHLPLVSQKNRGIIIPADVSFTALVVPTTYYANPDAPLLYILSQLVNHLVLHPKIREQGGAYGGGVSTHSISGTFAYYSYKDPHLLKTLHTFTNSLDQIVKGDFTKSDLEEAKLAVFQDIDSPVAPGARAEIAYAWWKQGRSDTVRQNFRDRLLHATSQELQNIIPRYFSTDWHKNRFVALAGQELFLREQQELEKLAFQITGL